MWVAEKRISSYTHGGKRFNKPKMSVPVYYQSILAYDGHLRWIYNFWLILKSCLSHHVKILKLLKNANLAGCIGCGKRRILSVLCNFLKIEPDLIHFAFGTIGG